MVSRSRSRRLQSDRHVGANYDIVQANGSKSAQSLLVGLPYVFWGGLDGANIPPPPRGGVAKAGFGALYCIVGANDVMNGGLDCAGAIGLVKEGIGAAAGKLKS